MFAGHGNDHKQGSEIKGLAEDTGVIAGRQTCRRCKGSLGRGRPQEDIDV